MHHPICITLQFTQVFLHSLARLPLTRGCAAAAGTRRDAVPVPGRPAMLCSGGLIARGLPPSLLRIPRLPPAQTRRGPRGCFSLSLPVSCQPGRDIPAGDLGDYVPPEKRAVDHANCFRIPVKLRFLPTQGTGREGKKEKRKAVIVPD